MVDWGDGSPIEFVSVDQINDTFAGNHVYSQGGVFTIKVTAIDSDGAPSNTVTTQAVVQGAGVVNGVLYIIGSLVTMTSS